MNKNWQFVIILIVSVVILDLMTGKLFESLYFSDKSKVNDRFIYSMTKSNQDILIFGSSRALHHYNPAIIQDSLNLTGYNVGSGGQNIYFQLGVLKSTLERYKPKIIILELFGIDFNKTPEIWNTEKLGVLLPFAKHSNAAMETVLLRGKSEQFKLLSSVYPYNSLQYSMFRNNYWPVRNHINGYIPIKKEMNESLLKELKMNKPELVKEEVEIDPKKVAAIEEFIGICKKEKIELYIFVSPFFSFKGIDDSKNNAFLNRFKSKYNCHVHNFQNDTRFLGKPEYFTDVNHLNQQGADYYSTIVAGYLRNNYSGSK